jgi:hypothetical protein
MVRMQVPRSANLFVTCFFWPYRPVTSPLYSVPNTATEYPHARRVKKAHIRNLMSVLFNHAMLWELIEIQANPMKLVEIPEATKRKEEPRGLTVEEFHLLLAQIEAEPQRTMVILAMCLG